MAGSPQGQPLGKVQGEAARRTGEPSGQGEEAPPKGFGGYQALAQTDARCPAGQIVSEHQDGQPGGVGGEAPRGEMVEPHAALEVADGVLDLGVAAMAGLQFEGIPIPVGDEAVIVVVGEEGQLGTGRRSEPHAVRPLRRQRRPSATDPPPANRTPRQLAPSRSASASRCVLSRHLPHHSHCRPPSAPPKAPADRRQPPVYPNSSPDHRACNFLTHLPLSSRCLSVSTGGFGLKLEVDVSTGSVANGSADFDRASVGEVELTP